MMSDMVHVTRRAPCNDSAAPALLGRRHPCVQSKQNWARGVPRSILAFSSDRAIHCPTGNGCSMKSGPPWLGYCSVAPFLPHSLHVAEARSWSLEVAAPQRMIRGVSATGTRRRHSGLTHCTHTHVEYAG